jgi:hypothetical protein
MMPMALIVVALAAVVLTLVYVLVRPRHSNGRRTFDAGYVSTRWLSELRRDEPWGRP